MELVWANAMAEAEITQPEVIRQLDQRDCSPAQMDCHSGQEDDPFREAQVLFAIIPAYKHTLLGNAQLVCMEPLLDDLALQMHSDLNVSIQITTKHLDGNTGHSSTRWRLREERHGDSMRYRCYRRCI